VLDRLGKQDNLVNNAMLSNARASDAARALNEDLLRKLVDADLALARAPLEPNEPHRIDQLDRDWFGATIARDVPGAVLLELRSDETHHGMTSRRKWSLRWNEAGQAAGLPGSVFVKATPDSEPHREMLATLRMHEIEANFYRRLAPELPAIAPQAFYAQSHPGGRFLIVLEDLGLRGARPYWLADACPIEHARGVTVALATLHARYWQSERLASDLVWVRPRTARFGWPWLREGFSNVRKAYLQTAEAQLPADALSLLRLWAENADTVFDYWETLPCTVLHGDSHLGNTYALADGSAGLFDWQVVFAGHGPRDLAYFVHSALTSADRARYQHELFDLYLDTLNAHGLRLDRAQAWNDYCLFILDFWDANMMTRMQGEYGHASSALLRNTETIVQSLLDNDVLLRLRHLLNRKV
jgi:hypothetical protein